jgi:hypothetical protein
MYRARVKTLSKLVVIDINGNKIISLRTFITLKGHGLKIYSVSINANCNLEYSLTINMTITMKMHTYCFTAQDLC